MECGHAGGSSGRWPGRESQQVEGEGDGPEHVA
jgi:hypothetical protein